MSIFSWVSNIFKKKETVTTTTTAPKQVAPVRNIDFGSTAKGSPERVGGVTVYNSQVGGKVTVKKSSGGGGGGGGGSLTYTVEAEKTTNLPTPADLKTTSSGTKTYPTINAGDLQPATASTSSFARGTKQYTPTKDIQVYNEPYITREPTTVIGYTKSGKKIYTAGSPIYVDPYGVQKGGVGSRPATKEETIQLEKYEESIDYNPSNPNKIEYNPEDYLSYKALYNEGQFPAIVRRGAYDFGKIFTAGILVPYEKVSGKTVSPSIKAGGRKFFGESALFVGFSPAMTTTAQTMVSISKPTKIKEVGLSQSQKGGKVQTDIYFKATKGGNVIRGKATGTSATIKQGNYYLTKGYTVGYGVKRSLTIKGVKATDTQVFASMDYGAGQKIGNGFYEVFGGKMGVSTASTKTSLSYTGAGVQISKKGFNAFAGGSTSKYGISNYAGVVYNVKSSPNIIYLVADKGGRLLINAPKSTPPETPFNVVRAGGALLTRNALGGFGTTLAPISSISATTPVIAVGSIGARSLLPTTETKSTNLGTTRSLGITSTTFSISKRPALLTETSLDTKTKVRSRGGLVYSPVNPQVPRQIVNITSVVSTKTSPRLKKSITPRSPQALIYFNPPPVRRVGGLPPFRFWGLNLPSNIFKGGKRRTGYTPSFSALIFNIKGSYKPTPLSRSGLNFRPITKGYKLPTGLTKPKKRRKKKYGFF